MLRTRGFSKHHPTDHHILHDVAADRLLRDQTKQKLDIDQSGINLDHIQTQPHSVDARLSWTQDKLYIRGAVLSMSFRSPLWRGIIFSSRLLAWGAVDIDPHTHLMCR